MQRHDSPAAFYSALVSGDAVTDPAINERASIAVSPADGTGQLLLDAAPAHAWAGRGAASVQEDALLRAAAAALPPACVSATPRPVVASSAPDTSLRLVHFAPPIILDPDAAVLTLPPAGVTGDRHPRQRGDAHVTPQHPDGPSGFGARHNRPIERSSVGYKLLAKAGWQEGSGLGAQGQGRAAPLGAHLHKGTRGLGYAVRDNNSGMQQGHNSKGSKTPGQPVTTSAVTGAGEGGGAAGGSSSSSSHHSALQQQPAGPVLGSKRVMALVTAELAAEPLRAKVARHRQLAAAEADAARERAIRTYLARAFAEPSATAADGGDVNPLLSGGSHRLRATNPLASDSDDE